MSKKNNSIRFCAVDAETGRRSGIWRVWLANDGADVYVAPRRLAGDFKLSIHGDNWNQLGFYSPVVRRQIRKGDKHFFYRWEREIHPFLGTDYGWEWLAAILLDPAELEDETSESTTSKVIEIDVSKDTGLLTVISVIRTEDETSAAVFYEAQGWKELKRWRYEDKGAVSVLVGRIPDFGLHLASVDSDRNGFGWQPSVPERDGHKSPFGFVFTLGNFPTFAEYSSLRHEPPPLVPNLKHFPGRVRPWSEAPKPLGDMDALCAILTVHGSYAELFVDPRSRCDHEHLVWNANDLLRSVGTSYMDDQWVFLPDGRLATGITTREVAEDKGLIGYRGNPFESS